MYNLICFPHYTCGGLLCDILSETFSEIGSNGGINSIQHTVGKIGDSDTVMIDYDPELFMKRIRTIDPLPGSWLGTHCWPNNLPLEQFDRVIVVTTATYKSKIYRWARAYYHYFLPTWNELSGMQLIDKARETAKNYLVEFEPIFAPNVVNIEFADVVDGTREFYNLIEDCNVHQHLTRWQEINSFLYNQTFWASDVVKYFYQAEFESKLKRYYRYE